LWILEFVAVMEKFKLARQGFVFRSFREVTLKTADCEMCI
jgi:hypothetical protein